MLRYHDCNLPGSGVRHANEAPHRVTQGVNRSCLPARRERVARDPISASRERWAGLISNRTRRSSQSRLRAPKADAPNILLLLVDDAGFGRFGTFGGVVSRHPRWTRSPPRKSLQSHSTTALCSPTRAALITGLRPSSPQHLPGITEAGDRIRPDTPAFAAEGCGTVGEVLRQNGYMTAWIGKNHNTPTWETSSPAGHRSIRWANGLGFDLFLSASMEWSA